MRGVSHGVFLLGGQLVGGVPGELLVAGAEQLVGGVHVRYGSLVKLEQRSARGVQPVRDGVVVLGGSAEPVHRAQRVASGGVVRCELRVQRGVRADGGRGVRGVCCWDVVQRGGQAPVRSRLVVAGSEQREYFVRL